MRACASFLGASSLDVTCCEEDSEIGWKEYADTGLSCFDAFLADCLRLV